MDRMNHLEGRVSPRPDSKNPGKTAKNRPKQKIWPQKAQKLAKTSKTLNICAKEARNREKTLRGFIRELRKAGREECAEEYTYFGVRAAIRRLPERRRSVSGRQTRSESGFRCD